MSAELRDLND
jgi:hypothetical protein